MEEDKEGEETESKCFGSQWVVSVDAGLWEFSTPWQGAHNTGTLLNVFQETRERNEESLGSQYPFQGATYHGLIPLCFSLHPKVSITCQ